MVEREARSAVDGLRARMVPVLRRHGVRRAAVFGSFARGHGRPDSDVDVVVELTPDKSLLDLVDLKRDLETALGRAVDLTEYDTLHPLIRETVVAEQVAVL